MLKRWCQVSVSFHLSTLLSSMLASFLGGFSHEEQDGSSQVSDPQTGSHWSGMERLIYGLRCPVWPGLDHVPISGDRMKFQLPELRMLPPKKLGHFSQQQGGNEDWAGNIQSVYCRLDDTFPVVNQQSNREGNSLDFPPQSEFSYQMNKASNFIPKCLK